ncbi:MAG: hypothetical protein AAGE52_19460 [Myxococcota bacterium]
MSRDRFVELMGDAVIQLPQDLRAVLRIVEDPEVDDASRVMIAGALLHVISQGTSIPGVRGTLQHAGSVMLIRLVLERAQTSSPEAITRHREESPELFGPMDEQLEIARSFLGDGMKVLEGLVDKLPKLNHQGHTAEQCVHDTESNNWLYDTVHVSLVETLEIDDEDVAREIKGADRIRKSLQARASRG